MEMCVYFYHNILGPIDIPYGEYFFRKNFIAKIYVGITNENKFAIISPSNKQLIIADSISNKLIISPVIPHNTFLIVYLKGYKYYIDLNRIKANIVLPESQYLQMITNSRAKEETKFFNDVTNLMESSTIILNKLINSLEKNKN